MSISGKQHRPEVVTAWQPTNASDSGLISAVSAWSRIWAFTPRYKLWARWTARRAVIRMVSEIRRREDAKVHACYRARESVDASQVKPPRSPSALKR